MVVTVDIFAQKPLKNRFLEFAVDAANGPGGPNGLGTFGQGDDFGAQDLGRYDGLSDAVVDAVVGQFGSFFALLLSWSSMYS